VGQSKVYRDVDADRYYPAGAASICAPTAGQPPAGYARLPGDCDDAQASVHPNAPEAMNGVDDDCDGLVDEQPITLQTVSLDGQAIDDGLVVDLSAARDVRVAVWVDTDEVLSDTSVSVDQSASGEDHALTLQSCAGSPTVACPVRRGYIIVDDAATLLPSVPEQTLLYEVHSNDGTAFRHRVTVLDGARSGATAAVPASVAATALDRMLDTLSDEVTSEIDEAVRAALGDLEDVTITYDDLRVEVQAQDHAVSGDNTGEGSFDGQLSVAVSLGALQVDASCFTAEVDDVAVILNLSPRVPEYGASASAGGWPSRYANPTLGAFTASWFDTSVSYASIQGQSPWDWAARGGELAFVLHDTLLTFGGQSVTENGAYDVIRDSIRVTGKDGCGWVEGTIEQQAEDLLGDISWQLYANHLIDGLRDEDFGSETFEATAATIEALTGVNVYKELYVVLDGLLQRTWDQADDGQRGLPLDRLPSVRNVLEYALNEVLHGGLPTAGLDRLVNLDGDLPLGDAWTLGLGLDASWFTGTDGGAHMSLAWSTRLTGAPDASLRYSASLLTGDPVSEDPSAGPNGAMASVTLGEAMLNQALYAVTTGGLLDQQLGDGTTVQARVPLWADVDADGRLVAHLRDVELTSTANGGYQHLVADGDAAIELGVPDDAQIHALEAQVGMGDGDVLASALVSLSLDGASVRLTNLRGRTLPHAVESAAGGWLEEALLQALKAVACGAPEHFVPVGVDDVAGYCAGDEVADTYQAYVLVDDALGSISDGDLAARLPGHYVATRIDGGLPQWDLTVVKAFDPYLTITRGGAEVSQITMQLLPGETASFDLDALVIRTFSTGTNPTGLSWTESAPWLTVDSAGLVTLDAGDPTFDDQDSATTVVHATWYDAASAATLTDDVRVTLYVSEDDLPGDDCIYTTHIYCP
ncbi:MAG TPA: putative metal-binding motif-containing protein, partial [Myxococcota bacterium]|nr:putative metal-binding motif-containing protein [Myxococcota bacterium]